MSEVSGRRGGRPVEEEAGGLAGVELARTCWAAFNHARAGAGLEPGPEDLLGCGDEFTLRWLAAMRVVESEIEASGEKEGASFSGTARLMVAPLYDTQQDPGREALVCLEAAVRHAANAMEFVAGEDGKIEDHEVQWRDWAAQRVGSPAPAPTEEREGG